MSDDARVEEINEEHYKEPDVEQDSPEDQRIEQNLENEQDANKEAEKSNEGIAVEDTKEKDEDDIKQDDEDKKSDDGIKKEDDEYKKDDDEIKKKDDEGEKSDDGIKKEDDEYKKDDDNDIKDDEDKQDDKDKKGYDDYKKEDDEDKKHSDHDAKEDDEDKKDDDGNEKEDVKDKKDDDGGIEVPPVDVVAKKVEEVDTSQIDQYEEEEEVRTKRIFSTSYLSSIYEKRPERCISIRSLYPPHSWPSSARLSVDSDVYPKESEHNLENVSKLKMVNTVSTVGKEESKFDLHEVPRSPSDHTENILVKPEVKLEITESVKPITPEKVEEEVEDIKITDIPFLKEVLKLPIDSDVVKKICFSETLLISYEFYNENDKETDCGCTPLFKKSHLLNSKGVQEMGGMSVNIESTGCFLTTFCTSQFSCLGSAGASRLLSVVDHEFGLLEEKKTEWHCMHDKIIEKSLHVAKDGTNFIAFRTDSTDGKVERHRGNISLKATGDLLLDGGLMALMRYLVISGFTGEFETWSLHITGDVCRCKFIVGREKTLYINNNPYLVKRIKKEFYRDHRYPDISKTYFLPSGHLVRHKWKGCRYFVHINPISQIPPKKHNIEYSWKDDIMLMSKYLDEKQKRQSEITTYMGDHPEIKSILQDYMLCLLQLKPDHVLDFTIDYFINLFRE